MEWEKVFLATRASLGLPEALLCSGGQVHLCPLHLTGFPETSRHAAEDGFNAALEVADMEEGGKAVGW